jgi:hypothetical protein
LEDLATLIARVEQLAQRVDARGPAREHSPDAAARASGTSPSAREPAPGRATTSNNPSTVAPPVRSPAAAPADNPFQRFVPPESRDKRERSLEVRPAREPSLEATTAHAEPSSIGSASAARTFVASQGLAVVAPAATQSAAIWPSVVDRLRSLEPRWAAMYEHGVPGEVSATRVVVVFPEGSFFGRQAQTPGGSDALRRAASEVFGATPEIVIKLASEVRGQSLAQSHAQQLDERKEGIKKRALNHPRVLEALKVFPELAQKQDVVVD